MSELQQHIFWYHYDAVFYHNAVLVRFMQLPEAMITEAMITDHTMFDLWKQGLQLGKCEFVQRYYCIFDNKGMTF